MVGVLKKFAQQVKQNRQKQHRKKQRNDKRIDIYSDEEEEQNGAGVNASSSLSGKYDEVENYEYHVDVIPQEYDEEIEEEEAFNDEDEERYGIFFTKKTDSDDEEKPIKKSSSKKNDGNLLDEPEEESGSANGDEEDWDEDDDDEFMDISEMLNDQVRAHELGAGEKKSTSSCSSKTTGKRLHETVATLIPMDEEVEDKGIVDGLSQHFSDNDEDEEEEEEEEDEQDGEKDDDDRATNSLQTLIEGLDSRNKSSSSNKQKKAMENITEACEESEYNISSNAAPDSKKRKLEINDLMGVLSDTTGFGGLKKQLEILDSRHSSSNGGTVAVPLAKRAQDKIERDVAYIKAKSEIKKWVPIVSKNRIADNLSFPMNVAPDYKTSNGELVSKFQPTTSLENEVQKLLEEGQLCEKRQVQLETLAMNKLSKEEMATRRAELAKMRSLMFYEEQKRKKIAKIKSKTYHKIANRAKSKQEGEEMDLETLKALDPEAAEERMRKMELERITERMSLKHKNTGKWAKSMLGKRDVDTETRRAIMDQLNKHDDLKRKISGLDSSDEEGDSEYDDDTDIIRHATEALDDIKSSIQNTDNDIPAKGVMSMKFMKRALDAQKLEAERAVDQLREDMLNERMDSDDDNEHNHQALSKGTLISSGNVGRQVFSNDGISSVQDEEELEFGSTSTGSKLGLKMTQTIDIEIPKFKSKRTSLKPLFEVEDFNELSAFVGSVNQTSVSGGDLQDQIQQQHDFQVEEIISAPRETKQQQSFSTTEQLESTAASEGEDDQSEEGDNPWLKNSGNKAVKKSIKQQSAKVSRHEKALEKLSKNRKNVLQDNAGKRKREDEESTQLLELGANGNLAFTSNSGNKSTKKPKADAEMQKGVESNNEDIEDEESNIGSSSSSLLVHKKDVKNLSKMDIMQLAFGDDGVMEEFEQEKQEIIEEDAPKEVDLTLPGWGSWAGSGLKAKERVLVQKPKPGEGLAADKRKDAKLKNVIINEKKSKKNSKYVLGHIPHGFENKEQYEKTIRMPLGKEWQTSDVHHKMIKPRISVTDGAIILPLSLSKAKTSNI